MRKSNTQKITDILKDSLKDLNIEGKLKEVQLVNSWEKVVGKTVAKYTQKIFVKDKKLVVILTSSVVRNELLMIKDGLIKALNESVGTQIIEDIVIR